MGVDMHYHIGPYLGVKRVHKVINRTETITGCNNKECKRYKAFVRSNFCHECGSKIDLIEIIIPEQYDAYNLLNTKDEFIDRLTIAGSGADEDYTYISNKRAPSENDKRNNFRNGGTEKDESMTIVHTTDFNELEEIKWFEKEFKEEIDFLKEELGESNVYVDWGIFMWYS